ncbi:YaiI/YqxD family protein [soil metagenome]
MIYVDADACPVKDEIYRVARRHGVKVVIAANNPMFVPTDDLFELVVKTGFGVVDDWIAEACTAGDVVITGDIPLAARALLKGARVLDHRGRAFTENDIHDLMATRDLMTALRAAGEPTRGPAPFSAKDRSSFLSKLDDTLHAVKRLGK